MQRKPPPAPPAEVEHICMVCREVFPHSKLWMVPPDGIACSYLCAVLADTLIAARSKGAANASG
jgi:hypothetical protein